MSAPVSRQAPRRRLWRLLCVATLITTGTLVLTAGTASAATPAGTYAYVTNTASATVSVVNTGTNSVIATVPVGNEPVGIATDPGGTRVYVTNSSSNTVSVIDTATNTVTATIAVGQRPQAVAVAPDSSRVYVANDGPVVAFAGEPVRLRAAGPHAAPKLLQAEDWLRLLRATLRQTGANARHH